MLDEFNSKIADVFSNAPEWMDFKTSVPFVCCENYKKIPNKHHCGHCKYCVSANGRTSRGYRSFKCEIHTDLKPFGFSSAACDDFAEDKENT